MNDELKNHLKGWVSGEEILEYIEYLERENASLNARLEKMVRYNGYIVQKRDTKDFIYGFDYHNKCGFTFTGGENKLPRVFSEYEKNQLIKNGLSTKYRIMRVEVRVVKNDK